MWNSFPSLVAATSSTGTVPAHISDPLWKRTPNSAEDGDFALPVNLFSKVLLPVADNSTHAGDVTYDRRDSTTRLLTPAVLAASAVEGDTHLTTPSALFGRRIGEWPRSQLPRHRRSSRDVWSKLQCASSAVRCALTQRHSTPTCPRPTTLIPVCSAHLLSSAGSAKVSQPATTFAARTEDPRDALIANLQATLQALAQFLPVDHPVRADGPAFEQSPRSPVSQG
ncbi:hypothetical protein MTO96_025956 [Rhipicephalus appendiculatus]